MGIILSKYQKVLTRKKIGLEPLLGSNSYTGMGLKPNLGFNSYTGPFLDPYGSRPVDIDPAYEFLML